MSLLSRRSACILSGSALLGVASRSARAAMAPSIQNTLANADSPLLSTPVHVPSNFIGMHAHRWPGGTTPPPTYGFGTARSHDHDGTAWNLIHLAPGQFRWESLDAWVEANSAAGRTLVYTLYGTPAWLSIKPDQPDLYGRRGGAAPPRDLQPLSTFITALIGRYNSGGKRRIHFVETWNEPHFNENLKDFWWGSAEQLVAIGRTCHLAAKAADPGVRILSPGFVGDLAGALSLLLPTLASCKRSSVYQYLTASDGHGAQGSNWCDGLAFHSYNVPASGDNLGYTKDIARLQKMLSLMNVNLPLFNTECGFIAPDPFRSSPPNEQARQLKKLAVLQAAHGIQTLCFYSHDDDFIGNPSLHPEIAQAIDDLHHKLAGATLHQITRLPDGTVRVTTDKETFSC